MFRDTSIPEPVFSLSAESQSGNLETVTEFSLLEDSFEERIGPEEGNNSISHIYDK